MTSPRRIGDTPQGGPVGASTAARAPSGAADRARGGITFDDWVMITPPLIIDAAQVEELVERLGRAITTFERTLPDR